MRTITDEQIAKFLLGQLPEDRRVEIEEQVFSSDEFFEKVRAIQTDLTHDYVRGSLSRSQRAQYESNLLNTAHSKERVAFSRELSELLAPTKQNDALPTTASGFWQSLVAWFQPAFALTAVATVALIVAVAFLAIQNRRIVRLSEEEAVERDAAQRRLQQAANEAEANKQQLEQQIANLKTQGSSAQSQLDENQRQLDELKRSIQTQPSHSLVAMFTLEPGLVRGNDEPEKVVIPASVQTARLRLRFQKDESFSSYQAELRTARGNLVWSRSGLAVPSRRDGQSATLDIPARLLTNGEYEITLSGTDGQGKQVIGYYYFIALPR